MNPNILNPNILNPNILNPNILNTDLLNPNILNPNILNPNILNPNILNPNILNPDILNPNILNPAIADVKDIIWTIGNKGNTTSAYTFKNFANKDPKNFAFQLLVYKIYPTASQANCQPAPLMNQELIVNILDPNILNPNILNPNILNPNILNPNILNPDILNATFYLAPYETAKVALRAIDLDKTDNNRITVNGQPVPDPTPGVPQVFPIESVQIAGADLNAAIIAQEVNTLDAANGITTPPAATSRLTIITQELPSGRVGQPYSTQLIADAGVTPYTWTLQFGMGGQPGSIGNSGLTLNSTGVISGTPITAGTFPFSVQVTDAAFHIDRRDLAVSILPAPGTANLIVVSQPNPCVDIANPQPTCAKANQVIVPATSVKVFDNTGAAVPGVSVTLSIGSGPVGAVLSGTLTRATNASGVAAFDNLTVNKAGTYSFLAVATGYPGASTANFNVVAPTIVIGNANDSGAGSLRQAMLDTNSGPGGGVQVVFNIPGPSPYVIKPLSPLPTMTRPIMIDATTQPGYTGQPVVQLDGSLAGAGADGLTLRGGSSVVRGLAIGGFDGNGVVLQTGGGNRISGNYIGTNLAGTTPYDPLPTSTQGGHAILIQDSATNIIGGNVGTTPGGSCTGDCNLLNARGSSGNGGKAAIEIMSSDGIASSGNQVLGNFMGVDVTGSIGLGGAFGYGVSVLDAHGTVIGDGTPAGRNVVSGFNSNIIVGGGDGFIRGNYVGTNSAGTAAIVNNFGGGNGINFGIETNGGARYDIANNVASGNATGIAIVGDQNTVRHNIIGLNAAGTAAIPNVWGLWLTNIANNNIVGGTTVADRNFISGNTGFGVVFTAGNPSPGVHGNHIIGNYIGSDQTGAVAIPNGNGANPAWRDGVHVEDASDNFIGGSNSGEGNLIFGNAGNGVTVAGTSTGVSIVGNSIAGNGGIGIDLGADGVTANHAPPNQDPGPNHFQNYPVLSPPTTSSVSGELFSAPSAAFTVQIFSSGTSNREGRSLVTTVVVNTDAAGHAFIGPLAVTLTTSQWITATATDASGNTSEFSLPVQVP